MSKKILFIGKLWIFAAAIGFCALGNANSLFYESCAGGSAMLESNGAKIFLASSDGGFAGLTCKDLKATFEATQVIGMALLPISVAMRAPGVKESLLVELAGLGLTMANPAVLGVTVIGAVGVVTIYFVMKQSLKECEQMEREELKRELIQQIKATYPGTQGENVPLEIQPEEDAA